MLQLPVPAAFRELLQDSPVLAETVTLPVGTVVPVTLKLAVTAWPMFEGFGDNELMLEVLMAFCAETVATLLAGV
jgi:hypothetical protein